MKKLGYIAIISAALSVTGIAQAKSQELHVVPFHHVEVKAAESIYAYYKFDPHSQMLICREDNPNYAINTVTWEYKGATRKLELPVTLKDHPKFEGYWADPHGQLVITNEFGDAPPNTSIYVSCEYGQ